MPNFKRRDKSKPNSKLVLGGDFLGGPVEPRWDAPKSACNPAEPCRPAAVTGCLAGAGRHQGYLGEPMNFASDNAVGVAPEILAAIAAANAGGALAYGNDTVTRRVELRFAELFEHEVAVFLVPTGTAANALAIAHLAPPWGAVLCHSEAHIATDECGAPEFFGGGLKLIGLPGDACKLAPQTVRAAIERHSGHRPHF